MSITRNIPSRDITISSLGSSAANLWKNLRLLGDFFETRSAIHIKHMKNESYALYSFAPCSFHLSRTKGHSLLFYVNNVFLSEKLHWRHSVDVGNCSINCSTCWWWCRTLYLFKIGKPFTQNDGLKEELCKWLKRKDSIVIIQWFKAKNTISSVFSWGQIQYKPVPLGCSSLSVIFISISVRMGPRICSYRAEIHIKSVGP